MKDLVFRCPSCKHPLIVEEAAAGKRVDCPHCHTNVLVPRVRVGILSGRGHDLGTIAVRQVRQIGRLELEIATLTDGMDSLQRRLPGQRDDLLRLLEHAVLVRDQLQLLTQNLQPASKGSSPIELPAPGGPEDEAVLPSASNPWRKLTVLFGGLAFPLAFLAAVL